MNLKALKADSQYEREAFNVSYGNHEYLIDVYHHLTDILEKDIEPIFGPERAGDVKHSNVDISKVQKMLGYSPDYSFKKGIKEAIEWYEGEL